MADFRLRIQFAKKGAALWLSHLEVVRALERCIRRSGLPYAISQGFSPHLKHSFSAALPVGTGSLEEYMDVDLEQFVAPHRALESLQAVAHEDLVVHTACYVAKDEPSLQVYFNEACYLIGIEDPTGTLAATLVELLQNTSHVEVFKKNKPKQYALNNYLMQCGLADAAEVEKTQELLSGSLAQPAAATTSYITMTMLSRPEGALRPEVLLAAVAGPEIPFECTSLTRTKLQHKEL